MNQDLEKPKGNCWRGRQGSTLCAALPSGLSDREKGIQNMLKGTGVSDGCGIGTAVVIEEKELNYSSVVYSTAEEEKERLNNAVNAFCEKTEKIGQELKETAGEKEAEIMQGHIEMIHDPFMISQMQEKIDEGSVAEAAVDSVCNMFIEMFSGVDDELTKQRVSDIKDIRDDLLGILLGVHSVDLGSVPAGSILVAHDFTPSMTGRIRKENVQAIIAEVGGVTSHSAILARAMGIPAVLSVTDALKEIHDGDHLIVDGFTGKVLISPDEAAVNEYREKQHQWELEKDALQAFCNVPTKTSNGISKEVYGNIGKPEDVQAVVQNGGEGIGLFRTEFLFMDRTSEPTEEEQFKAYSAVAKAMNGREVIIRTLDIGGDKDIPYLCIDKEENPFLGHRAIRYCLDHQELFRRQIRAILRASEYGNVKIMLPLITTAQEITEARRIVSECVKELQEEGKNVREVPVGIMVETPAAAIISDELARIADFFSIGTNDLTGYVMAVDRGNAAVADLYDIMQPPVLRAIEMTIRNGKEAGIPVGMCGEGAADPRLIPRLLEWGLDEFSVSASSILRTRKIISEHKA